MISVAVSGNGPQQDAAALVFVLHVGDLAAAGGQGLHDIAKVLAGGTDNELLALLKQHFKSVKHAKPPASRKDSSELYVMATGFRGDVGAESHSDS